MDIARYLLIAALATNAYLLVYLWNQDYGHASAGRQTVQSGSSSNPQERLPDTSVPDTSLAKEELETAASEIPDATPVVADSPEGRNIEQPKTSSLIRISTDVLRLWVNPRGGDLVGTQLLAYPASLDSPDQPYVMLDRRNQYAAQSGLVGTDGPDAGGGRPSYQSSSQTYVLGDDAVMRVPLTYVGENGLRVTKTYTLLAGSYIVDVEFEIENGQAEAASVNLFAQIKRDSQPPQVLDGSVVGVNPYLGAATNTGSRRYQKLKFKDIAETPYSSTVDQGYMAIVQHYFLTAWVPNGPGPYHFTGKKLASQDTYLFGFTGPSLDIAPGESALIGASFYVGPKDQYVLRELADGLDLTVDYGFLWWMAQPLFYALTFMHGLVNNWGAAIILLTVLIKMLLYPLSAASFRSMAKMRGLQPEMDRLREQFSDNRQKLSQAMMELYTKEGANPLGGCLPMLLQMPVFIALYWVLLESVELRQAPLDGYWISDLSAMDPWFILPILMGASMYLTQLMQPEPPDPMQARVFKMMPIMFTFFFLWFPSGLVLYWLCNNLLSAFQQWWVNRQISLKNARSGR